MSDPQEVNLSRREREMMDIIYEAGQATAAEVRVQMPSPPSYSAVRATLHILVEKRHLRHRQDGPRYIYSPTVPREKARVSALRRVIHTFFDDSPQRAVAALLEMEAARLSEDELNRLAKMIEAAKREGR